MSKALDWTAACLRFHARHLFGAAHVVLRGTHWWHFAFALVPAAAATLWSHPARIVVLIAWAMLYSASVYAEVRLLRRPESAEESARVEVVSELRNRIQSGLQLFQAIKGGEAAGDRVEEWEAEQAKYIWSHIGQSEALEFEALYDALGESERGNVGKKWEHIPQLDVPYLRHLIAGIQASTTPVLPSH